MKRPLANLLTLTALIAAATVLAGWWTVPVVSGVWVAVFPRRGAVIYGACAGIMAWGGLLIAASQGGKVKSLDRILAEVLHLPPGGPIVLTVLYAGLLAGAAALLVQSVRPATASLRTR